MRIFNNNEIIDGGAGIYTKPPPVLLTTSRSSLDYLYGKKYVF